jgi:hypothetical protein
VAARDVADRVGHGEDGQAEGEGDAEPAHADVRVGGRKYGGPASAEHEHERADELRRQAMAQARFDCHDNLLHG